MPSVSNEISGVVGGTIDASIQTHVDRGGPSAVDDVMAHRRQMRHRIEEAEHLAAEQLEADTESDSDEEETRHEQHRPSVTVWAPEP